MKSWFKRITTLDILNGQIASAEKSLLENQHTADHYAALAEGSKRTLDRLKAHKVNMLRGSSEVVSKHRATKTKTEAPQTTGTVAKPTAKLRAAT